ncbi:sulfatase-like hydrolase/transferase [Roseivirga misakiensis]|uniref:Sulfatase n=1 Tax=Roseivirga misakiensis TaxID=1563681 RepID=A0A1E5SZ67_9BACT|nr:sulfatase-like hydrolase/transferase [Roseivirga misakiensis]OEK04424.1 sulfatase [Roseivirga misakiensis]
MNKHLLFTMFCCYILVACSSNDDDPSVNQGNVTSPNILLIIADDLGLDALSGYSEGSIKANTPHLDRLRNSGITFNNFWTNSVCSPTRATILTGKYGYSTGVKSPGDEISPNEISLQRYINEGTESSYATAIVGKWHLSGTNGNLNPEDMGIDYYAGLYSGAVTDYYNWSLTEDGVASRETDYVTTKFTDLAIDWVSAQTKPWFLWLAYNAPHSPFHLPPASMHSQGNLPTDQASIDANSIPYYMASIEAMDFQIGRLLDNIDDDDLTNTAVIFIGDNGTPNQVSQSPYGRRRAKGTMYQGGINVPMFISGYGVNRIGSDNALINSTDLFTTIASLAGIDVETYEDSKNFSPLLSSPNDVFRGFTYAEFNDETTDEWTVRNDQYKLIVNGDGAEELYDLSTDPYEDSNLLDNSLSNEAQNAKTALEAVLSQIRR